MATLHDLAEKIAQARLAYYSGADTVEDAIYDDWVDQLALREPSHPLLREVGANLDNSWPKVKHTVPMGSQLKVKTFPELTTSLGAYKGLFHVSYKCDGLSAHLSYRKGVLVQALTRGNGVEGEDITPNVRKMGVPSKLAEPVDLDVRGELILHESSFQKHFASTMKNARNAGAGITRRRDGSDCEHITFYAFDLDGETTKTAQFRRLESLGFKVPWAATVASLAEAQELYETVLKARSGLDYAIDGLIVQIDDISQALEWGEVDSRPKASRAYKFPADAMPTKLLKRIDQVGAQGVITPVFEFEPVNLLGAEVTRASAYNQRYINLLGLDIGAEVLVCRANDVIPRIVSVAKSTGTVSQPPTHCPVCGASTVVDGEDTVCPNTEGCSAQVEGRLARWIAEQGIMEWGDSLLSQVVATFGVRTVAGLYGLSVEKIATLPRMGERSALKAWNSLRAPLPLSLEKILGGLAIPNCSTSTARALVQSGLDTPDKIFTAGMTRLTSVPNVGPQKAACLRAWLDKHPKIFEELEYQGIIPQKATGPLAGKTVVFTGSSTLSRKELSRLVETAGGVVGSSVTKATTYLVMADPNSTSSKAVAARKSGVAVIGETQFLELVNHEH